MRATILSLLTCAAAVCSKSYNIDDYLAASQPTFECSPALHACMASSLVSNPNAFVECYNEAGCTHADPRLRSDEASDDIDAILGESELRRRQNTNTAETETPATTADKTTGKPGKTTATDEKTTSEKTTEETTTADKSTAAKTTSAPSSASATTTADSTTSDSKTTTSDESTAAATTTTTSDSTTSTSTTSADSVTSGTTTGTLACSVTNTVSTKVCSYTQNKMVSCTSTTTAVATCAPGKLCFSSVAGADVCMKKDNSLSTSGLIVTLIFGVGIIAALLAALIIHIRGKSKAKRAAQVAAMMASSMPTKDVERSAVPSRAGQSEDNLPLMAQTGGRGEEQYYGQGRGAPRLHQGVSGLGQAQPPRY